MAEKSDGYDDAQTAMQAPPPGYAGSAFRHRVEVRWADASGPHASIIDGRSIVGSAPSADVVIADPTVSRIHAEFELRKDGLWVRDLGSRNGTFVENVQVSAARIPDGGRLRFGGTVLRVQREAEATRIDLWPDDHFGPLIGGSSGMRELFARIARVAPTSSTVLIQGETGTGKELVARAIHEASPRARAPFVIVDCAALPETLLEAELFGHAKGSFTGALAARAGAIEAADTGTVFLDEIGELPLSVQPKLLRVLESRATRRIGESAYRKVDVRFVSATHRDLRTMVNEGAFREDLYFRLAVLPVTIPALRDRPDDIASLVASFAPPEARGAFAPELIEDLARRPWLGNVRELRNFVERALALGADEALALSSSSPAPVSENPPGWNTLTTALERPIREAREVWMERFEREYVPRLLARHRGDVAAAAQAAGIDRTHLYRLIRKHAL